VLIALGVLWPVATKLGLGRLPGDIVIERENFGPGFLGSFCAVRRLYRR
jgi:hypothetical protein